MFSRTFLSISFRDARVFTAPKCSPIAYYAVMAAANAIFYLFECWPQDLRQLFVSFGNVTSVRVLQDLRKRNCRVYAFVSYHSETKHDAAMSLNGIVKSAQFDLGYNGPVFTGKEEE
ncbi:hypothetical protein JHK87_049732 [Glycine soja]|nr:hypothetical protein JHK87_049732 [Glycine soja]